MQTATDILGLFLAIFLGSANFILYGAMWIVARDQKFPWWTKKRCFLFIGLYFAAVVIAAFLNARDFPTIFWREWPLEILGIFLKTGHFYLIAVYLILERRWRKHAKKNQNEE